MSKLFMYGTSLEGIEQLMVMVPNFQPTRSGIVINNYFNCEGGAKDCNLNVINFSKDLDKCGYIGSNFKTNVDNKRYKDLVMECFRKIKNNSLRNRLKELSKNFKGEVFLNHRHKERFYNLLQDQDLDINYILFKFIAILFLLTADESLWKVSKHSIEQNGFNLKQVCLRERNTEGYALYQTAKTISTGKECIKTNELADRELIDDYIFKVIINSALINYKNLNDPIQVYNGKNFPLYGWKESMATLELSTNNESEFIYPPSSDIEIEKALMRLGVPYLQDCDLSIDSHELPDNLLEMIPENITSMERVDSLNKVASKFVEMKDDIQYFERLMEYVNPRTIDEVLLLADSMYEFEIFDGIKDAEGYGRHMICESGHFEYDSNLEDYIDFKRYGQVKVKNELGALYYLDHKKIVKNNPMTKV